MLIIFVCIIFMRISEIVFSPFRSYPFLMHYCRSFHRIGLPWTDNAFRALKISFDDRFRAINFCLLARWKIGSAAALFLESRFEI